MEEGIGHGLKQCSLRTVGCEVQRSAQQPSSHTAHLYRDSRAGARGDLGDGGGGGGRRGCTQCGWARPRGHSACLKATGRQRAGCEHLHVVPADRVEGNANRVKAVGIAQRMTKWLATCRLHVICQHNRTRQPAP